MQDRQNWIQLVAEGMRVYDSAGETVGTVIGLHYGTKRGTATVPREENYDSIIEDIAEVFSPDEFPDEMRERLLQEGFITIDRGVLQGYGYVLESNIASVTPDGIHLNVQGDTILVR